MRADYLSYGLPNTIEVLSRIKKTDKIREGSDLLFCPVCGWSPEETNVGIKPVCPECDMSLKFVLIDEEAIGYMITEEI